MPQVKKQVWALKQRLLVFVIVAAFASATPEFAGAQEQESALKGFYFKFEGRGAISDGDEFPYAESGRPWIQGETVRRVFDIGLNPSFSGRVGAGFRLSNSWDVGLLYSGLKTSDRDPLAVAPLTSQGSYFYDQYFGLINPGLNLVFGYSSVQALMEFSYNVVDFEAGYSLQLGETDVRLFGGLRFAEVKQSHQSTFAGTGAGGTAYVAVLKRDMRNWGIGPRLGVEASMPVGGGFRLAGSVSGSALFGDRDTTDSGLGLSFGFPIPTTARLSPDRNVFGNVEGDLGIGYAVEMGNARSMMITLGYRAEAWLGVSNTRNSAISHFDNTYGSRGADQFFHGPFLRGALNF